MDELASRSPAGFRCNGSHASEVTHCLCANSGCPCCCPFDGSHRRISPFLSADAKRFPVKQNQKQEMRCAAERGVSHATVSPGATGAAPYCNAIPNLETGCMNRNRSPRASPVCLRAVGHDRQPGTTHRSAPMQYQERDGGDLGT